jgi:hypothetical protein
VVDRPVVDWQTLKARAEEGLFTGPSMVSLACLRGPHTPPPGAGRTYVPANRRNVTLGGVRTAFRYIWSARAGGYIRVGTARSDRTARVDLASEVFAVFAALDLSRSHGVAIRCTPDGLHDLC